MNPFQLLTSFLMGSSFLLTDCENFVFTSPAIPGGKFKNIIFSMVRGSLQFEGNKCLLNFGNGLTKNAFSSGKDYGYMTKVGLRWYCNTVLILTNACA